MGEAIVAALFSLAAAFVLALLFAVVWITGVLEPSPEELAERSGRDAGAKVAKEVATSHEEAVTRAQVERRAEVVTSRERFERTRAPELAALLSELDQDVQLRTLALEELRQTFRELGRDPAKDRDLKQWQADLESQTAARDRLRAVLDELFLEHEKSLLSPDPAARQALDQKLARTNASMAALRRGISRR